jgi:hypothetical protein
MISLYSSHYSRLALKGTLLFQAHSFSFDIKASLVTYNPFFRKHLKYCETGFLPLLGPEKYFLFARHENSFVPILLH